MDCPGQERCSQRLPEIEALFETDLIVDKVSDDVLGQQGDEIGDDQAGDLELRQQDEHQQNADHLFPEHQRGLEMGFVRTELDVVAHPGWILDRAPDGERDDVLRAAGEIRP